MKVLNPRAPPILFSEPMVLALLAGLKTQTRRTRGLEDAMKLLGMNRVKGRFGAEIEIAERRQTFVHCPYGGPGGGLWVRETWAHGSAPGGPDAFWYRAGHLPTAPEPDRWKPSIHMPRTACRIELEVKAIRVERLQEISEADAIAEGIKLEVGTAIPAYYFGELLPATVRHVSAVNAYKALWEEINGTGSWDRNPFVWVVEFKLS